MRLTLPAKKCARCAAALASLELFEENNVLQNVNEQAGLMGKKLQPLLQRNFVGEIRQRGNMVGIELVRDAASMMPLPSERRTGHLVTLAARRRGVIVRPRGDVIVLMPAQAMPLSIVERLCDVTIEAIDEVMDEYQAC